MATSVSAISAPSLDADKETILIIGKESAGKSQLVSSLTGQSAQVANFHGTTISCEEYVCNEVRFVDTPGILLHSDTVTTAETLKQLSKNDVVLLVAKATHLDHDLFDLLPLLKEKRGIIVVTFMDKIRMDGALEELGLLAQEIGVDIIGVDARNVGITEDWTIREALRHPREFKTEGTKYKTSWCSESRIMLMDLKIIGPILSFFMLFLPALLAVHLANTTAEVLDPAVQSFFGLFVPSLQKLPSFIAEILVGRYGFVTMGPLLLVWAVPTVIIYAFGLGFYKASGLMERITSCIHPFVRHFALTGRDLVRYVMGFGCNVPAVICTRACSRCTRIPTTQVISYGSICSYQLGATLAVFAKSGHLNLVIPFMMIVIVTTMLYMKLTHWRNPPLMIDSLAIEERNYLECPTLSAIWREARAAVWLFFLKALPVFFVITFLASVLDWLGVLNALAAALAPFLKIFRLPESAALPVVLSSIRKDGILLFASDKYSLDALSSIQILTGVFLAGMILPCLVTLLTSIREVSLGQTLRLLAKQVFFAVLFSLVIAWGGLLFS